MSGIPTLVCKSLRLAALTTPIVGLILSLLLSACSGAGRPAPEPVDPASEPGAVGQAGPVEQDGAGALPAPSAALHLALGVGDSDRSSYGSAWESVLPNENVSSGIFAPLPAAGASPQLADCAYCVFLLGELAAHDGPPRIELGFDPSSYALPEAGELRIALANLQSDRWDWFACGSRKSYSAYEAYQFNCGSLAPYVSDNGELLCLVLQQQGPESELSWVLAGDNESPDLYVGTDLESDPLDNLGPRTVTFSCWPDTYGGPIASMDYDWEGDGVWDYTSSTETEVSHEYQPGQHRFVARVTDNAGLSATKERKFTIIDPNNVLPTAEISSDLLGGTAPLEVLLDASGSTDDKPLSRFQWDLDSDGEFEAETSTPQLETVLSQYGPNLITLRVTDTDLAWDETSTIINVLDGWEDFKVADADATYVEALSCGLGLGRRPCAFWLEGGLRRLKFARSASGNGDSWAAPVTLLDLASGSVGAIAAVENGVNNRPLVAWSMYDNASEMMQLWTRHATNDACTAWSAAQLLFEADYMDGGIGLAMCGNKPRLVFGTRSGPGSPADIHLLRSSDNLGSVWETDFLIAGGVDLVPNELQLISDGSDMVLAASGTNVSGAWQSAKVMVWNTSGGDPLNWSPQPRVLAQPAADMSLSIIDGRPALAASGGSENSTLSFWRSLDSAGAAWPPSGSPLGSGTNCQICFWDGQAGVAFNDTALDQISFVRCDLAGGAWSAPEIITRDTFFTDDLALCMNLGRPFVFYSDPDEGELRCSSWHY